MPNPIPKLQCNPHSKSCSLANIFPGLRAMLHARSSSFRATIESLLIVPLRSLIIYFHNIKALRIVVVMQLGKCRCLEKASGGVKHAGGRWQDTKPGSPDIFRREGS